MKNVLFFLMMVIISTVSVVFSEVCIASYTGFPEELNDSTIVLPSEVVGLGTYIPIDSYTDSTTSNVGSTTPPSITFIVDESASMWMFHAYNNGPRLPPKDPFAQRYTVTKDLITLFLSRSPLTEISLIVFAGSLVFDPELDSIFTKYPLSEKNKGFLGPLDLTAYYSDNEETIDGYDMLVKYLDTIQKPIMAFGKDPAYTMIRLKYGNYGNSGTNINCAFGAAKHAASLSRYPRNSQYIIFISDGLPDGTIVGGSDFIKGTDIPTTFTLYFSKDGTVPEDIKTFTSNVQKNGYSGSNILSEYWAIDLENGDLEKILFEKVINIITEVSNPHPLKITVNGVEKNGGWDGTGFQFADVFPLTGAYNSFEYSIVYSTLATKDTTRTFSYTIALVDNAITPDKWDLVCWDRTLTFHHNGVKIMSANETMDSIELRFTPIEGDTLYNYFDVDLELTTTDLNPSDKETIRLISVDNYFTCKLPIITSSATENDKQWQHAPVDSLVAVFRNPKLPLDTLRVAIPYSISTMVTADSAFYFDTKLVRATDTIDGADGRIDSIFIYFSGKDLLENSNDISDILSSITLPAFRGFVITDTNLCSNGLGLMVEEKMVKVNTAVTNDDIISIDQGVLPHGGLLVESTLKVKDRVAPVIMRAAFIDYQSDLQKDTLSVVFSEPIQDITYETPFVFYSNYYGFEYSSKVKPIRVNKETVLFHLLSTGSNDVDYIFSGDSIWIDYSAESVVDKNQFPNVQDQVNIKRPFQVGRILDPFEITVSAVNPVSFSSDDSSSVISTDVVDILLSEENKNTLTLKNGGYSGLLVTVKPSNSKNMAPFFSMKGTIAIFDPVGNTILPETEMMFSSKLNMLAFAWNGKNINSRNVAPGTYVTVVSYTLEKTPMQEEKRSQVQLYLIVKG